MRSCRRAERGQTSVEYLGVIVVVAVIVAGLVAAGPGLGNVVGAGLRRAVCLISRNGSCPGAPGGATTVGSGNKPKDHGGGGVWGFLKDRAGDVGDAAKATGGFVGDVGVGAYDSVKGTVTLGFELSPARAAVDPEGFIRDGRNFAKGTWFGVTHPAELGKALIDWKDLTDGHPGKAVGQWLPDIALALLTGGLGTAADGSTEAARDLSRVEKAAEAARAAEVATEAAQRGGRVVIGAMEDLTASGTIGRGERTLLDQLTPSLESVEANWARNERVLLKEMDRGVPIRDASVDPETGELLHIDERTRFINRERDLLRSHGWTYDRRTHLWSPP